MFPSVRRWSAILPLLLFLTNNGTLYGAPISWNAATNIVNDADVSTHGTLVAAVNFDGPVTTVNGVTFQPIKTGFGAVTSSGIPPFTGLSVVYRALLGTGLQTSSNVTITFNGLTIGQHYEFQVWSNNSDDSFGYGVFVSDFPVTDTVQLDAGGMTLGQYVIGTFTADSASQQFLFEPDEVLTINGFQLRAIDGVNAEVPEPASLVLWSLLSMAGLTACRHRKRATAA